MKVNLTGGNRHDKALTWQKLWKNNCGTKRELIRIRGVVKKLSMDKDHKQKMKALNELTRAIEKFDENTQKYSKRMEKLTIVMLILAVTQCLLAFAIAF